MWKLNEIQELIRFAVDLAPATFDIFKDRVEIFVESNIKNERKRSEYLKQLEWISIEQGVYYSSYPGINEEEAAQNNREAADRWFQKWMESMTRFLLKLKWFLESDLNVIENNKEQSFISSWTHIQAGWDIIIWDNNKNTVNEIDKLVELIGQSNLTNKEEVTSMIQEFRDTNDRSKLVDVFSILWNGASINSMIIALSNLLK